LRVCILGSSGQIGSSLSSHLNNSGHEVHLFDIENSETQDLRVQKNQELISVLKKSDFCFFLAFDVGGSRYLKLHDHSFEFIDNNLRIIQNTFSILDELKIPFIFASSQMSTMVHSNYGILKLLGEKITQSINGLVVTFWNIYGSETSSEKYHVISDFIAMSYRSNKIQMLTDGEEVRDFLHVTDCSNALEMIMLNYEKFLEQKNIHIASFSWTKIIDIARIVSSLTGSEIVPGLNKDFIQRDNFRAPNRYLLEYWAPTINIAEGIKQVNNEYRKKTEDKIKEFL
jgi:nucleoside-diphosphate-sugar epimerase